MEATYCIQHSVKLYWSRCNHINIAAPLRGAGKLVCACSCLPAPANLHKHTYLCVFLHVCAVWLSACVCVWVCHCLHADSLHSNLTGYYHWGWLKMYIIKTWVLPVVTGESLYQAIIILYYSWWFMLNTLPSKQSPQILLSLGPPTEREVSHLKATGDGAKVT